MLADAGATFAIVGHSERRQYHGEKDAEVCAKAAAAHRAGLAAIVCVGETQGEREAGRTLDVVRRQLRGSVPEASRPANLVVAYEPVWAIGTGLTPTAADVAEVHALIRDELRRIVGKAEQASVRILYGGSVKPVKRRRNCSPSRTSTARLSAAPASSRRISWGSRGRIWRRRGLRGSEETAFARACRRPGARAAPCFALRSVAS